MTKAELEQEVNRLRAELASKNATPITAETLRWMVTEWEEERDRKIPELVAEICEECVEAARLGRKSTLLPPHIIPFPGLVGALRSRGLSVKQNYALGWRISWEEPALRAVEAPAKATPTFKHWWQFWRWFA